MNFKEDKIAKIIRANKRLSREASRIEGIFRSIKEGIILTDAGGDILYANAAAKNILGFTEDGQILTLSKILPQIDSVELRLVCGGTASQREFEIAYPEHRFIKVFMTPVDGEKEEAAIIISDLTNERISARDKIESEKIASVLKLASGVAHELGNPINSISIHLQLALKTIAKMEQSPNLSRLKESVEICSQEVSRLDGIIKHFLKALRPARPDFAEINPLAPLAETLKFLQNELQDLNIKIEINTENSLPSILGDTNLLKQLYFNLIKNAMEAMDLGGIIKIGTSFDDNFVKISISDNGCGIDQDEITRIFEPYFTTKTDGHGLGMMIASEIVKSHGGSIGIDSRKDEGTTIMLSFPRKDKRIREIMAE